jgi:hypothetical protein
MRLAPGRPHCGGAPDRARLVARHARGHREAVPPFRFGPPDTRRPIAGHGQGDRIWPASRATSAGPGDKQCLTKLQEGQVSVTKLACDPRFQPCAAWAKIILCECLLIFPELCETFPVLQRHRPSQSSFRQSLRRQIRTPWRCPRLASFTRLPCLTHRQRPTVMVGPGESLEKVRPDLAGWHGDSLGPTQPLCVAP